MKTPLCSRIAVILLTGLPLPSGTQFIESWGADTSGQVANTPTGVGFSQVAGGVAHSLALRLDGSLISWGNDGWGVVSNTPAGPGHTAVALRNAHAHAVRSDGSIVSWGQDALSVVSNSPAGTGFTRVAAGGGHSLALKSDGSIVSWGEDYHGLITNSPSGTGFTQVAAGRHHALALREAPAPVTYCTPGTSGSGCTATISASGTASATAANGFSLTASTVEGQKSGLFFFGTSGRWALPWGAGTSFHCIVLPVNRAGLLVGTGTLGLCDGSFSQDLNAHWTAKPAHNPGAGALVQAQLWCRDPSSTSNRTTSLSDALEFGVSP